ncbi:MAG: DUF362 domain-containing protein [Spirochaetales bacterium]|nr:DUF362 domain-containing protein [Spirochaetales bacterium]
MVNKNLVVVSKGKGPFHNIKTAFGGLDLTFLKGKSVLIKPNIGRSAKKTKGVNTHHNAIAAVIEVLKDCAASKIAIGESPLVGVNTLEAFEKAGVRGVAQKYNCELLDLDAFPPVEKEIPGARVVESTKICSPVLEYDIILSLPVAKTHMHTGVTLGIKNMKGCLYKHEKVRFHQLEYVNGMEYPDKTLDTAISDLATILLPDITVIDGFTGMQGLGPSGGESIESDFALASWHPLGADVIACVLMGQKPEEIPHLRLVSERLNFSIRPEEYRVIPDNYKDYITVYKKPPQEISITYPDVVVTDKGSCSACQSTVMLFLKRFKDDFKPYVLEDKKLHLAIGKGIVLEEIKKGTILIGNCTHKAKEKGLFVSGCPPVPTRIYKAVVGKEPDVNEPEID